MADVAISQNECGDGKDSKSNREKVYSAGGDVSFGKVYNCRVPPLAQGSRMTVSVFLSKYTAVSAIKKSPESKSNRSKVCRKGKTLYVLGAVTTSDSHNNNNNSSGIYYNNNNDNKEYFVFSEETCVYKREWADVEGHVEAAGTVVREMEVVCVGEVKQRYSERKKMRRRKNGRDNSEALEDTVEAFKVQFTNDPLSSVWLTAPGLHHMAALSVPSLCGTASSLCSLPVIPSHPQQECSSISSSSS